MNIFNKHMSTNSLYYTEEHICCPKRRKCQVFYNTFQLPKFRPNSNYNKLKDSIKVLYFQFDAIALCETWLIDNDSDFFKHR